ncbi:hypothetical protein [Histidinibacterium aquaticum]|uniref:Uncharacterized protein n=1 Tax=Histidinibacterium aquaticum TaxID=2613962 RepID=A0A5J5GN77_9RHOB|nr:hypothetical protein [Histidinibacterium aquaticum]KAA9009739.1 hypothetical protein F3S47_00235 [Histidinibacterium aquaticum]
MTGADPIPLLARHMAPAAVFAGAALAPGLVLWRHALAGPMMAAGLIRPTTPPAPKTAATRKTKVTYRPPGRHARSAEVTLVAFPGGAL